MTPRELEISNRSYDILAAFAVGCATAFVFAGLYFFLGLYFGVIGIHRTITDATRLYFYSSPVVLIPGLVAGICSLRYFRKKSGSKPELKEPNSPQDIL